MKWSCTGKYFIVCIGENDKESKKKLSEVKVWSVFEQKIIQTI